MTTEFSDFMSMEMQNTSVPVPEPKLAVDKMVSTTVSFADWYKEFELRLRELCSKDKIPTEPLLAVATRSTNVHATISPKDFVRMTLYIKGHNPKFSAYAIYSQGSGYMTSRKKPK